MYSDPYATGSKLTFDQIKDATFSDFVSNNNGSFLYVNDAFQPTFDIKFNASLVRCQTTGGFEQMEDLNYTLKNVNMTMPSLTGNTFYFAPRSQGTIAPFNSTFERCNTSYAGGIFYLYKG